MRDLKQPRAYATREKIIREATRLFALKGYHDTKLDEVIRAAQITSGAFFHHFAGKEEMGFAVIDAHMERRRQRLQEIEQNDLPPDRDDPLERVFRRLNAIQEMVRCREEATKGGCIIGNLSTALSDTHDAFRQRLAECFDEMAMEFKPHLDAVVDSRSGPYGSVLDPCVDTWELARYIVSVIEGSIMLARTLRDRGMIERHFSILKEYVRQALLG